MRMLFFLCFILKICTWNPYYFALSKELLLTFLRHVSWQQIPSICLKSTFAFIFFGGSSFHRVQNSRLICYSLSTVNISFHSPLAHTAPERNERNFFCVLFWKRGDFSYGSVQEMPFYFWFSITWWCYAYMHLPGV